MEKNYFYFEPYVHINTCSDSVVIFNTLNQEYLFHSNELIIKLVKELLIPENFRVLDCSDYLKSEMFLDFARDIETKLMGRIIKLPATSNKPIQSPPVLTINKDIKYYTDFNNPPKGLEHSTVEYVHRLCLYINNGGINNSQNQFYNTAYLQFECLVNNKNSEYNELSFENVFIILNGLSFLPSEIVISGGNIFAHSQFKQILNYLNSLETNITYYFDFLDYNNHQNELCLFGSNSFFKVFLTPDMKVTISDESLNFKDYDNLCIIIRNEDDFNYMQECLIKVNPQKIKYQLFVNKMDSNSWSFLNTRIENVLSQDDTINVIESKALVNRMLFGNVYVDFNGDVFMHMTQSSIGNIEEMSIYRLLLKEFTVNKNNVWFLSRKNVEPCNDCAFALLCPNISGYELFLNKYNFCFNAEKVN